MIVIGETEFLTSFMNFFVLSNHYKSFVPSPKTVALFDLGIFLGGGGDNMAVIYLIFIWERFFLFVHDNKI